MRQFATLLAARLTLEQTLDALVEQAETQAIREILAGVRGELGVQLTAREPIEGRGVGDGHRVARCGRCDTDTIGEASPPQRVWDSGTPSNRTAGAKWLGELKSKIRGSCVRSSALLASAKVTDRP